MNHVSTRRQFLLAVSLMLVLVLLGGGMGVYVMSDPDLQSAFAMAKVAADVRNQYNDNVNWDRMFNSAMTAMTDQLDRYSFYVDSAQMSFMHEEFTGAYGGIGVTVMPHDSGLTIVSVREGSPAAQVTLLSGDIIIQADTTPLAGLSPEACTALLRGTPGSKVAVTAVRPATLDTLTVTVQREKIDLLHIPFAGLTDDSILYIRLLDFEAGAAKDVKAVLDSLVVKAAARPRGVILDLRGNPGGLLAEARHTADLFLEGGQLIVGIDARHRWQEEQLVSSGHDLTGGLPMAVMVDRGSASAAEIVSGALRQLGRAVMVGDTTFGKGLVQGFTDFDDGSGLRLTIARYYLFGNVYLNEFDSTLHEIGRGLAPDYTLHDEDRDPFPRALESSQLLRRFSELHQDEIVTASDGSPLDTTWVSRFQRFARHEKFVFASPVTRQARLVLEMTRLTTKNRQTSRMAKQIYDRAHREDTAQFTKYAHFITRRLKQLAWERKYGEYQAYREAVINDSPEIRATARLLRERI